MKKIPLLLGMIGVVLLLMSGCSTENLSSKSAVKKETSSRPSLAITSVHVTMNDGHNLDLAVTMDNNTNKAIYIYLSEFALNSGTTTLSSTSRSKVPAQIPANSKTNITLDFDVKGQLSGTIKPKLAFQPSGDQPELFESLGDVNIPVSKNPIRKPTTSNLSSNQAPSQPFPSMTYTTDTYGESLSIFFHNLGQYSPTKLEMIVPNYSGNNDIAIIDNGSIQPNSPSGSTSWQMNNGNIEFLYPHADWGASTIIRVVCVAPGKKPITLSFSYKVPQN